MTCFAAAGPAVSLWLPAGLMTAGVALLGVLVYLAIRDRAKSRPREELTSITEEELDRLKRAGDRAALLTAAAEKAADALDERVQHLEQLLDRADEALQHIQSNELQAARQARPSSKIKVEPKRAAAPVTLDPLTRAVYELADAGRSPVQIAGELKEHTGKIELILNLRKSGSAPANE